MKKFVSVSAIAVYGALLAGLWAGFRHSELALSLSGGVPRAFASFALLLAPLWFFGFGAGEPLKRLPAWSKIAFLHCFRLATLLLRLAQIFSVGGLH